MSSASINTPETETPSPRRVASGTLLTRNAVLSLLGESWNFVALLVCIPILVANMGQTGFGLFSLVLVVLGYLTFLDVGVSRASTKYVSEHLVESDMPQIRAILRAAVGANLALGFAGGLVFVAFAPLLARSVFRVPPELLHQAQQVLYAIGFSISILLVQGVFRGVLTSFQRFGWIAVLNGGSATVQYGVACFMAWKHFGVGSIAMVIIVTRLFATFVYAGITARLVPGLFRNFPFELSQLWRLLCYGSWVTVSQIMSPLLTYLDRMLIAYFLSLSAVTVYSVPMEMATRLRIIPAALVATLFPAFSERGSQAAAGGLHSLYRHSNRFLLLLLLPCFLFVVMLGPDVLAVWMGRDFAASAGRIFQVMGMGALLNCLACIPYSALQALGRPDVTGKFHLLELPIYVGLCLWMIPAWGVQGAAVAGALRFALDAVLLFWAAERCCSLPMVWADMRRTMLFHIPVAAILFSLTFASWAPWARMLAGLAVVAASFGASWLLLLRHEDKSVVLRAMKLIEHRA